MILIEKIKRIIYWDLIGALLCVFLIYILGLDFTEIILESKGFIFGYYGLIITIIVGFFLLFFNFKDEMIMFLKGADVFENYKWHIFYNFKINFLGVILLIILLFVQNSYILYFQLFILCYSILSFIFLIFLISIIISHQSELRMIIKKRKIKS
ncbi:MAG: hypothetical protein ACLFPL_03050 [Candidatus Nanoarchaeia archaeon]